MKRLLTKYGIVVLSLAAIVAILLSVMTFFSSTSAAFPNLAGIIAAPFRQVGTAITDTVSGWVRYITDYDALVEENRALKAQIAEMEAEVRQSQGANEENRRLRSLLQLQESHSDYRFVDAELISWGASMTATRSGSATSRS